MKKNYMKPAMLPHEASTSAIIAQSFPTGDKVVVIDDDEVDGEDAWTKSFDCVWE
ncbi:MAG: hypothetical protein J5545_04085 [Bacteroidaceae bacterium]|nr:hypothetical protein [Bacteroidaceae bacterium]